MKRHKILAGLLAGIATLSLAWGQAADSWRPAAVVGGVPYHTVEELRSFYKLTPAAGKASRDGAYEMGNADVSIELGPGVREMSIGGVRVCLCRPLQKTAEGLLISREDWVKWVDPILRPTYIEGRRAVKTVIIDAGHGGHDAGTESPHVNEADATLQVAQKLRAELEKQGLEVKLTREADVFISDQRRVEAANAAGENAIFVSLHLNSGRSDFSGTSVYALSPASPGMQPLPGHAHDAQNAALAYALQAALNTLTGAKKGACRRAHYSLLSTVSCPAVWVEMGYASHAQEGPALASAAYQATLAHALAQGIATYAHALNPETHIPVQAAPPPPVAKPTGTSKPTSGKPTGASKPATGSKSSSTGKNSGSAKSGSSGSKTSSSGKASSGGKATTPTKTTTPTSRRRTAR